MVGLSLTKSIEIDASEDYSLIIIESAHAVAPPRWRRHSVHRYLLPLQSIQIQKMHVIQTWFLLLFEHWNVLASIDHQISLIDKSSGVARPRTRTSSRRLYFFIFQEKVSIWLPDGYLHFWRVFGSAWLQELNKVFLHFSVHRTQNVEIVRRLMWFVESSEYIDSELVVLKLLSFFNTVRGVWGEFDRLFGAPLIQNDAFPPL